MSGAERRPGSENQICPRERPRNEETTMGKATKVKKNVKGLLNQRVRMGLFTVPLWLVGAAFLTQKLMARRRRYA